MAYASLHPVARRTRLRERLTAAFCVAVIVALLGAALLRAFDVGTVKDTPDSVLKLLPEAQHPPAEKPFPARARSHHAGTAAPPNLRSRATPIVAPTPEVRLIAPPPVTAAPIAGAGAAPSAGASNVTGPGSGAGGQGVETGAGEAGNGGGDDGTDEVLIAGRIKESDFPRGVLEAGIRDATVHIRFTVGVNGRVSNCIVARSSGSPELDETTCRLITQRFRYRPATDAQGRPVAQEVEGEHRWSGR